MVSETKMGIRENYGFFFPLYIQKIMMDIDRVKSLYAEALKKITDDFSCVPEESKGIARRSRQIFAQRLVAGYLCEELFKEIGIESKTKEETEKLVNDMFKELVLNKPVESDSMRALQYLADVIGSERSRFYVNHTLNENISVEPPKNSMGTYGDLDRNEVKIIGTRFNEIMEKDSKFIAASVRDDIIKWGIGEYKNSRIKPDNIPMKCVVINLLAMNNKLRIYEEEEGMNRDEQEKYNNIIALIQTVSRMKKTISKETLDLILETDTSLYLEKLAKKGRVCMKCNGKYTITF